MSSIGTWVSPRLVPQKCWENFFGCPFRDLLEDKYINCKTNYIDGLENREINPLSLINSLLDIVYCSTILINHDKISLIICLEFWGNVMEWVLSLLHI
jgi:hypothetical protein